MLENVCEEALSTVLCPSRALQVGAPHYHLGTLTESCDNKRTYLGRPSSRWGLIITCQSPICAMWGLRAWIQRFKSQLGHSLAGGFVQSLTTSVPVPFPTQLTAPTSQNQDAGCGVCSGSQRDVVLTTVIMKMMKAGQSRLGTVHACQDSHLPRHWAQLYRAPVGIHRVAQTLQRGGDCHL